MEIKEHKQISNLSIPLSYPINTLNPDNIKDVLYGHNNHALLNTATISLLHPHIWGNNNTINYNGTSGETIVHGYCFCTYSFLRTGTYDFSNNLTTDVKQWGVSRVSEAQIILSDDNFDINNLLIVPTFWDTRAIAQTYTYDNMPNSATITDITYDVYYNNNGNILGSIPNTGLYALIECDGNYFMHDVFGDRNVCCIDHLQDFMSVSFNELSYFQLGKFNDDLINGASGDDTTLGYYTLQKSYQAQFRQHSYALYNAKQAKASIAMTGVRFFNTKPNNQTEYNNNVMLAYMDEERNIDCYNVIKSITEINSSDTYNKDINTLPIWIPPAISDKDSIENMLENIVYNYAVSPFTNVYYCGNQTLIDFATDIATSETIPDGYNVFENIVSVQATPCPLNTITQFGATEQIKVGNKWTSAVTARKIDTQKAFVNVVNTNVSRQYNDFRDFSPYTTYQLYVPLFGLITLPDTIVNRKLVVKANYDLLSGDITYIICIADNNNNIDIIDKITVNCTSDIEFTAENNAIKKINVLKNQLSSVNSVVSGASSLASGNVFGIAQSITSVANSLVNTDIAKNQNYLSHNGTNNSLSGMFDSNCFYLIINKSIDNKCDYSHTIGYIYNNVDTISNHVGFCVCSNVDIATAGTKTENDMIKTIMESGFYI